MLRVMANATPAAKRKLTNAFQVRIPLIGRPGRITATVLLTDIALDIAPMDTLPLGMGNMAHGIPISVMFSVLPIRRPITAINPVATPLADLSGTVHSINDISITVFATSNGLIATVMIAP